jgi:hypothetical protein
MGASTGVRHKRACYSTEILAESRRDPENFVTEETPHFIKITDKRKHRFVLISPTEYAEFNRRLSTRSGVVIKMPIVIDPD